MPSLPRRSPSRSRPTTPRACRAPRARRRPPAGIARPSVRSASRPRRTSGRRSSRTSARSSSETSSPSCRDARRRRSSSLLIATTPEPRSRWARTHPAPRSSSSSRAGSLRRSSGPTPSCSTRSCSCRRTPAHSVVPARRVSRATHHWLAAPSRSSSSTTSVAVDRGWRSRATTRVSRSHARSDGGRPHHRGGRRQPLASVRSGAARRSRRAVRARRAGALPRRRAVGGHAHDGRCDHGVRSLARHPQPNGSVSSAERPRRSSAHSTPASVERFARPTASSSPTALRAAGLHGSCSILSVVPFALGVVDLIVRGRRRALPFRPALRAQRARLGVWAFGGLLVAIGALVGILPTGAALPLAPYSAFFDNPPDLRRPRPAVGVRPRLARRATAPRAGRARRARRAARRLRRRSGDARSRRDRSRRASALRARLRAAVALRVALAPARRAAPPCARRLRRGAPRTDRRACSCSGTSSGCRCSTPRCT